MEDPYRAAGLVPAATLQAFVAMAKMRRPAAWSQVVLVRLRSTWTAFCWTPLRDIPCDNPRGHAWRFRVELHTARLARPRVPDVGGAPVQENFDALADEGKDHGKPL